MSAKLDNIRTITGAIIPVGTKLIAKTLGCVISAEVGVSSKDDTKSVILFMGEECASLTAAANLATRKIASFLGIETDENKRTRTGTQTWAVVGENKATRALRALCPIGVQKNTDGLEWSDEPIVKLPEAEKTIRSYKLPTSKAAADVALAKLDAKRQRIMDAYDSLPDADPSEVTTDNTAESKTA